MVALKTVIKERRKGKQKKESNLYMDKSFYIQVNNNNIVDIKRSLEQLTDGKPLKEKNINSFVDRMFSEKPDEDEGLENFKEDLYDSYDDIVDSDEETEISTQMIPSADVSERSPKTDEISTLIKRALNEKFAEKEVNPPISTLIERVLEKDLISVSISVLIERALETRIL